MSFRYSREGPEVLRDVTLAIEPGELVALVGASGAGKSTLAALCLGLIRPTSGRILFDGRDLVTFDLPSLRRQLGVVTQQTFLFNGSIRANIALGDPSATLSRVQEAARNASIDGDIRSMPMGYDTYVADGGASLSGGQRQRLALARALLQRPAVLLLDEATSSLDTLTEKRIHDELAALRSTRIVIAHRLSTVMAADRILVLEEGRIAAAGTHETLMAGSGLYRKMVEAGEGEERRRPVGPAGDEGLPSLAEP